jgi:hypothetical protein
VIKRPINGFCYPSSTPSREQATLVNTSLTAADAISKFKIWSLPCVFAGRYRLLCFWKCFSQYQYNDILLLIVIPSVLLLPLLFQRLLFLPWFAGRSSLEDFAIGSSGLF